MEPRHARRIVDLRLQQFDDVARQLRRRGRQWRGVAHHDAVAPAWIGLAECDPLVDEGLAYADRLRLAGVPVQLELWRGLTHDFIKMGRAIAEAGDAQASIAAALREAFGLPTPPAA